MSQYATPTVAEICAIVGRGKIARAAEVGLSSVSNAVVDNRFPARWFFAVRKLCAEAGIECPEHLFNFVGVEESTKGAA